MKRTIFLLLVIIGSYSAQAQSANTPEDIIAHFFAIYEKDGLKPGLDNIFSYGDKEVMKALSYIKDTLAGTAKGLGQKYSGYELILKKNITPSYGLYSYLIKYPSGPLRFNFIFYKPQDKWVIIDFSFDSQIVPETRDFIRLH